MGRPGCWRPLLACVDSAPRLGGADICQAVYVALRNPSSLPNQGHEKQIDPETFKDFYNCWKEAEAEAQEVSLPLSVMEHLDKNECVYKLSSSVKTNRGVGKIAMTQKRLFLLTEGRPGYVEISTFRNIEVRVQPAGPHCLLPGGALRV